VRRALTDYTHDAEQSDDITMLILKYGVPPKVEAVMALPAEEEQLVHVRNFVNAELDRRKAPKNVYDVIDAFAKDLFACACRHAYPGATSDNLGEVRVGFEYRPNPAMLKITIADDGAPYDPLAVTGISATNDRGEQIVDELSYERTNGSNIVSFSKSW
jgi:anti-sigma regulatory factor (Ser/Thr protein kinase)